MCQDLERIGRALGALQARVLEVGTDLAIDVETAADLLEGVLASLDGDEGQDACDDGELAEVEAGGKWWYWH